MVHLPNEIWLQIADYCDDKDLWLGLRPVNRQLLACAEKHFSEAYLPDAILDLKIRIPTYDMRNPMQSRITFKHRGGDGNAEKATDTANNSRSIFYMTNSEPQYYASHFLSRWKGMVDAQGGRLNEKMQWELTLCGRRADVRLRDSVAVFGGGDGDRAARLLFEWRATMTSFYRSAGEMVEVVGGS